MRKLIVSNFVTLDGFYEGKDKNIDSIFDYYHEDYHGDDNFDFYNAERMRAADTLLSGRASFLGNKEYWSGVLIDPNATAIRREFAGLIQSIEKVVVSDQLTVAEFGEWENTRIVKQADAVREITTLKEQEGRDIFMFAGRTL